MDPNFFGVSVCSIDGQRYSRGDTKHKIPILNISKVITYCMALEEQGCEYVHRFVGREPSGRNHNDLVLNPDKLPHNPLIDSGGILCTSLIRRDLSLPDRFEAAMDVYSNLMGNKRPTFGNSNYLCEREHSDRNYSLGFLMRGKKVFPPQTDLEEVLALFSMMNSIEVTTDDLSVIAG